MPLETFIESLGQARALGLGGLVVGMVFGFFAQRSRFCLRSATIEFSRQVHGGKLTVWLFAFSVALLSTQGLVAAGWLDVSTARQLATRGSLSGAAVGGALFGVRVPAAVILVVSLAYGFLPQVARFRALLAKRA